MSDKRTVSSSREYRERKGYMKDRRLRDTINRFVEFVELCICAIDQTQNFHGLIESLSNTMNTFGLKIAQIMGMYFLYQDNKNNIIEM